MPISIKNSVLYKETYKDEYELQDYLERNPDLIALESEPKIKFIAREVSLPSAGILDVLLIDEAGSPIAVEVKLERNAQSRREVVAQAFDYISDLSCLTVDELDDLVEGKLRDILDNISSEANLWKICGTNLRAGNIKLVIAVDDAQDDLIRIIRYINDHSDLDVRLVAINKYSNGEILVPNILVSGNADTNFELSLESRFESVISAYNSIADIEFKTRNKARTYRYIYPNNWQWYVHYEFVHYRRNGDIGVELHLENDSVKFLASVLEKYDNDNILSSKIEWDPKWSKGRGRIKAIFPNSVDTTTIAQAMKKLISKTKDEINDKLTSGST